MYSCHSVLECYNLFSGVKFNTRLFCFIRRKPSITSGVLMVPNYNINLTENTILSYLKIFFNKIIR